MTAAQGSEPPAARPRVVGELVEYRPGEWVRAGAVVAVGPELSELVHTLRREAAAGRERAGLPPEPAPEPTRLKAAGAGEWWHSPYPVDALVEALAEALANAHGSGRP